VIKRRTTTSTVSPHTLLFLAYGMAKTLRILLGESLAERSEGARGLFTSSILNVFRDLRWVTFDVRLFVYSLKMPHHRPVFFLCAKLAPFEWVCLRVNPIVTGVFV
jgi:hypothetical protein